MTTRKCEKVSPVLRRIMSRRAYALGAVSLLEKVVANNHENDGEQQGNRVQMKALFTMLRKHVERRYEIEKATGVVAE